MHESVVCLLLVSGGDSWNDRCLNIAQTGYRVIIADEVLIAEWCYSCIKKLGTGRLQLGCKGGFRSIRGYLLYKGHCTRCIFWCFKVLRLSLRFWFSVYVALLTEDLFCSTSVVSGLAVVGSLTGSRHRVLQGADSCILDPQRCAHQQQHCLPGALHLAPAHGPTFFTLIFQREPQRHAQWDFIPNAFLGFKHAQPSTAV